MFYIWYHKTVYIFNALQLYGCMTRERETIMEELYQISRKRTALKLGEKTAIKQIHTD